MITIRIPISDITGGWDNLLQGLISTIVAGLLTFLVAVWVVRREARRDSRAAMLQEARLAARTLVAHLGHLPSTELLAADTQARAQIAEQVSAEILVSQMAIGLVDIQFANAVSNIWTQRMSPEVIQGGVPDDFWQAAKGLIPMFAAWHQDSANRHP